MADSIKFIFAVILTAAAVAGFYIFADQSMLLRVIALLVVGGVVVAILLQTATGRRAWAFAGDARTEVRKVVWPSRKETTQTTLVVVAMVVVISAMLWLVDLFLMWAVRLLTGQGG